MGGTRRDRIYEMMLADSMGRSNAMMPVPSAPIMPVLNEETQATLVRSIDNAVVNADAPASALAQNVLGYVDRTVAAATTAQSMLRNAIQVPITTASNAVGGLVGQVSTNVVNDIGRSVGNIVELQNVGMPGLQTMMAASTQLPYSDAVQMAIPVIAAANGMTTEQATQLAMAMEPAHLYDIIHKTPASTPAAAASLPAINIATPPVSTAAIPTSAVPLASSASNPFATPSGSVPTLEVWAANKWHFPDYSIEIYQGVNASGRFDDLVRLLQSGVITDPYQIVPYTNASYPGTTFYGVFICPAGATCPDPNVPGPNAVTAPHNFSVTGMKFGTPVPPTPGAPLPTLPAPGQPSIPDPPIPPISPRYPPQQPCIPICQPTCPPPPKKEPCDPCEDCNGTIYLNTDQCFLKVFDEKCPPPRTEPFWREIGSTTQLDALAALIDQYGCGQQPDPNTPGVPLPPLPPRGGMNPVQLCNFLPAAGAISRFSPTAIFKTFFIVLNNEVQNSQAAKKAPLLGYAMQIVADIFITLNDGVDAVLENLLGLWGSVSNCSDPAAQGLYLAVAGIGVLEKYLSAGLGDLQFPFLQQARYACPSGIPTPAEATMAVLADTMAMDEWNCIVRANNQRPESYIKVADAMRRKLEPLQLILLRAREKITDDRYTQKMRELGYTVPEDRILAWMASEWMPGPSDIVRMMVRDTVDPNIVQRFGLDADFDAKYQGKLKDYAKGQRVPDEVMQLYWRAHWNIPSPTQLHEFYQRFRSKPELWPGGDPLKDLTAALEQQDILPKWIPLFIESTFRPLTRIDAKRALELDVITEADAIEAWKAIGYSDTNAKTLVGLALTNAKRTAVKNPVVKRLAKGELTEDEAKKILRMEGVPSRYDADIVDKADIEGAAARRKACMTSLRRRYFLGEFDETGLQAELVGLGLAVWRAIEIGGGWTCELRSRSKQIAAKELVSWYLDSVISPAELKLRLLRLRYDPDDVVLILRQADLTRQRQQTAKEKRALKEQDSKMRREDSDRRREEADQRRVANEAKSLIASITRQLSKSQSLREGRQDDINKLYALSTAKLGLDPVNAVQQTDALFAAILATSDYTQNEALSAMDESLKMPTTTDVGSWERNVTTVLTSRVHTLPLQQLPSL
jgi:hypothetical protein